MRIIFLCGSVEPGKDGVGDYTRRLCGELLRTGHDVQIVSLCDHHAAGFVSENQEIEGTSVLAHRIPVFVTNSQRYIWSQDILNNFQPNWISLQFVPYSFNPKGLPFWIPSFLKKLKGNHQWHIMFHELWLGIDKESSFKYKCIGKIQQFIIKNLIHKIRPHFCSTQNQLYQFFLQSHGIVSDILPICSNIPLTAIKKESTVYTQFVLFGTIHHGAPFNDFITDLVHHIKELKKPIKFIFIGRNGPELSNYIEVLEKHTILFEVLGIQSENKISQVLRNSDYGITTTPYYQTEKSGVYAAYREHQINTICVSRKWTPTKGQYDIPHVIKYQKNNLILATNEVKEFNLKGMTIQFMNSIQS